jgi:hypothetical protein
LTPDEQARVDAFMSGAVPENPNPPVTATQVLLSDALMELRVSRSALASSERIWKKQQEELAANWTVLTGQIATLKGTNAALESNIRALAVRAFAEGGSLHPVRGVDLRLATVLEYDPAVALGWAKAHGMALIPEALDVKMFEKIAKSAPITGVTVSKQPVATIASDLVKALAEPEAADPAPAARPEPPRVAPF